MLKLKYETASDVPEALKDYYAEQSGVYVLQAEGLKTEGDVAAVKDALDKERRLRRDAEAKVKDFENKYSLLPEDFDIDEYNRLKDTGSGDLDAKLKDQRERLTAQFEKEKKKLLEDLSGKDALIGKHVKMASLEKAMSEANVAQPYRKAVEAMFKDSVIIEGDQVYLNEKPVSEAIKEWASSDEGKHYIAASQNSGGGTNTAKDGNGTQKTMARSDFASLPASEQMSLSKSGIQLTD